jgi:hypothetical protein
MSPVPTIAICIGPIVTTEPDSAQPNQKLAPTSRETRESDSKNESGSA